MEVLLNTQTFLLYSKSKTALQYNAKTDSEFVTFLLAASAQIISIGKWPGFFLKRVIYCSHEEGVNSILITIVLNHNIAVLSAV